jgi:hypothetical protein
VIGGGALAWLGSGVVGEVALLAGLLFVESYKPRHGREPFTISGVPPPPCEGCARGRHYPHDPLRVPTRPRPNRFDKPPPARPDLTQQSDMREDFPCAYE